MRHFVLLTIVMTKKICMIYFL
ncbi:hypothetical protein AERO8C_150058 [Aeromonas veronii]|uniref:Uncharacterized protein n=1 Tax=Aeromonas veronii TaxID=654 RepID=A0A653KVV3_AERVE|nr:hypothetical protein AERO8C_150058 [Aeromonas veronii]